MQSLKGANPALDDVPAKKYILFCDGVVFSLDRGLLMGAIITTSLNLQVSYEYHMVLAILKILINSYLQFASITE